MMVFSLEEVSALSDDAWRLEDAYALCFMTLIDLVLS